MADAGRHLEGNRATLDQGGEPPSSPAGWAAETESRTRQCGGRQHVPGHCQPGRAEHAKQHRLRPDQIGPDMEPHQAGLRHHLTSPPGPSTWAYAEATSSAKEVSDMNRLAERLGYLWQRYVAWRDPRPFNR
jgi:hypothetical protein